MREQSGPSVNLRLSDHLFPLDPGEATATNSSARNEKYYFSGPPCATQPASIKTYADSSFCYRPCVAVPKSPRTADHSRLPLANN